VPWPHEAAAGYTERGWWEGRPLGSSLHAAADAAPDRECLVDGPVRMTFRELMARADGAALRLAGLGLRPDDRVVVQLPNCWEFVVLALACLRLGVLPVMALPAHRHREISAIAEHAEARAIAVAGTVKGFDHEALARRIADESDTVEFVLAAGGSRGDSVDLRALCAPAAGPETARKELDDAAPDPRGVAMFLLSGGTTGLPKLIARTHDDYGCMIRLASLICDFGSDTVYLAVLPLAHGFPMAGPGVLGALMRGGRVVIERSPAPERAFAAIERERATVTSLVPAAVQRWLEYRAARPEHDLSSLRFIQSGGARLPDHVARRVAPELGCALQQVYGMGEGLLCLTRLDDPEDVVCHTQGRPVCPDDELMFVDVDGAAVAEGEPGILLTRGPYTPRGYYRAPELNLAAFTPDGWYRTGDVVRRRPDGNLVVEGRDKDVINRGGEKISADEIEEFAGRVDGVARAAAVAMPDEELGEQVCLYVVPRPGRRVALDDIRTLMERAGVARFKLPARLVLVGGLPATNVGKTDKAALRADIRRRMRAEAPRS
jgi:2,3-dihydroxybenzoate-AMP ligase